MAKNRKTPDMNLPMWFDGQNINEALFCEEFLQERRIIFANGAFFTPDGRVTDDFPLRGEIYDKLKFCAVNNIPRKITNILEVLKLEAQVPDFPPEQDRIHLSNGTLLLNGTFTEGRPAIVRSRLPVAYNPDATAPVIWLNFLDAPIASFFCKKEGDRVRTEFNNGTLAGGETEKHLNLRLFHIPEKYSTPNIILCKLCFVSYISMLLAQATGISILIFGLIFGIILHELGLLEENCLTQANALTFVMAGAVAMIFVGLTNTTPGMLLGMIAPLLVVLAVGTVSCSVIAVIVGRIVHFDWRLSIAMAVTAFFGFPGTYLISLEVSRACGKTDEEKEAILHYIMPKLVIAGIVSVSVVSGLLASIMVHWI